MFLDEPLKSLVNETTFCSIPLPADLEQPYNQVIGDAPSALASVSSLAVAQGHLSLFVANQTHTGWCNKLHINSGG